MSKWIFIALGGAGGSMLRYAVGGWVQTWTQNSVHRVFPAGTLVVNVIGCLAIGILATMFSGPLMVRHEEYRLGVIVGILGGFTTFSAFSWETNRLAADSEYLYASLNVLLSVGLGLIATWGGMKLAQTIWGP